MTFESAKLLATSTRAVEWYKSRAHISFLSKVIQILMRANSTCMRYSLCKPYMYMAISYNNSILRMDRYLWLPRHGWSIQTSVHYTTPVMIMKLHTTPESRVTDVLNICDCTWENQASTLNLHMYVHVPQIFLVWAKSAFIADFLFVQTNCSVT